MCPVREPGVRGDDGGGRGGHPRQLPQHLRPLQVQGELSTGFIRHEVNMMSICQKIGSHLIC